MENGYNDFADELVLAHWSYIKSLLESEIPEDVKLSKTEYIEKVGFHYKSAMIHGYKHAVELLTERD